MSISLFLLFLTIILSISHSLITPTMDTLANGNAIVAYGSNNGSIFFEILDANGTLIKSFARTGIAYFPCVLAQQNGNFVFVFKSINPKSIMFEIYDGEFTIITSAIIVKTDTSQYYSPSDRFVPTIFGNGNGFGITHQSLGSRGIGNYHGQISFYLQNGDYEHSSSKTFTEPPPNSSLAAFSKIYIEVSLL